MDEDLVLALQLQEEWNLPVSKLSQAQEPLSLVDESWELVDPTPDLQALFVQFNDRFFWGQLEAVEVKWSRRMTLCAGICTYEGRGGMCSVRLSEPLLKLRPRKDLVETLLHEMIHAYLFVTNNDKDREGHGPEFCKHMHRINRLTGANITLSVDTVTFTIKKVACSKKQSHKIQVYHTFHDEVDEYRRHWWRCDGPCQFRKPYYGYVKRATNRAPSAHDYWWAEHQNTCGGTYVKIKEPENYSRKGKGKTKAAAAENKDKPRRVVPFSGKGHVLGETNNAPLSGKRATPLTDTRDLLSQDHSRNAGRPDSRAELKFEQSGSWKTASLVSPVLSSSPQNVLSNYFPRISAASQKAFRSMTGSPRNSVIIGDISKNSVSSSSQRKASSSKTALRNSLKAVESPCASQGASGSKNEFLSKRPRLEDKTVFDRFFIKREKTQSSGNDPECSPHPAAAAQGSSPSSGHGRMVSCPVCQSEVVESQINEHLDLCLEDDSSKVKSSSSL